MPICYISIILGIWRNLCRLSVCCGCVFSSSYNLNLTHNHKWCYCHINNMNRPSTYNTNKAEPMICIEDYSYVLILYST